MAASSILRLAPRLAAVLLVLPAREARATCMQVSRLRPVLPDCSVYELPPETATDASGRPLLAEPREVWPASRPISAIYETGTCCSPPGGPGHCSYQPASGGPEFRARLIGWDAKTASQVVVEGATKGSLECRGGLPLYTFDRPVAPGSYTLEGGFGSASVVTVVADEELRGATRRSFDSPPTPPPSQPSQPPATAAAPGCRTADPGPLALLLALPWALRRRRSST